MCKCNLSPHEALYHVLKYTKAHSNLELSCMLWVLHSLPCTMYERLCAYINQNDAPPILRIKSKIHPHFLWWRPNAMAKTTLDLTMFYVYDLWAVFNLWALANLYIYIIYRSPLAPIIFEVLGYQPTQRNDADGLWSLEGWGKWMLPASERIFICICMPVHPRSCRLWSAKLKMARRLCILKWSVQKATLYCHHIKETSSQKYICWFGHLRLNLSARRRMITLRRKRWKRK